MNPHSQQFIVSPEHPSRGILRVTGKDALDLLHRLTTADLLKIRVGQCCTTIFTTEKGRILDYVIVGRREEALMLLTSPGKENIVKDWVDKYTIMEDVQCVILTEQLNAISAVGPEIPGLVASEFSSSPEVNSYSTFTKGCSFVHQDFGLMWTHLLLTDQESATRIRHTLSASNVPTLSAKQYDLFRVLHGIPGEKELRGEFSPFEAGVSHAISFSKGCYIGQEVIARLDTYKKVQRRLVGFLVDDYSPVSSIIPVTFNGVDVGWITSVTEESIEEGYPGLGIVRHEAQIGNRVEFQYGNIKSQATLVQFNHSHQAHPIP